MKDLLGRAGFAAGGNGNARSGGPSAPAWQAGPRGDFSRAPGRGKGYAGKDAGEGVWRAASFDGRHASRARRARYFARLAGAANYVARRTGSRFACAEDGGRAD